MKISSFITLTTIIFTFPGVHTLEIRAKDVEQINLKRGEFTSTEKDAESTHVPNGRKVDCLECRHCNNYRTPSYNLNSHMARDLSDINEGYEEDE